MSSRTEPPPAQPLVHFNQSQLVFKAADTQPKHASLQLVEQDLGSSDDFYNIHLDLVLTFPSQSDTLTVPFDHILTVRNLSAASPPSLLLHLRTAASLGTLQFSTQAAATSFLRTLSRHAHLTRLTDPALPHPLFALDPYPRMRRAAPTLASSPSKSPHPPNSYPQSLDSSDATTLLTELTLSSPSANTATPSHRAIALDFLGHFAKVTQAARDLGDRISAVLDEDRRRAREAVENALAAGTQALDAYATLVASASTTDIDLPPVLKLDAPSSVLHLTRTTWANAFGTDGKLTDSTVVRYAIFSSGIDPGLRCDVWPFLLGVYPWHSTHSERDQILKSLRTDYAALKLRWQNVYDNAIASAEDTSKNKVSVQSSRPSPRDLPTEPLERAIRVHEQIEKDVTRTDRGVPLYEPDRSPATRLMATILNVYAAHDTSTAYCQGMSDFLSPLVHVFVSAVDGRAENVDEALVFWCFEGLMRRMESNFRVDQSGMRAQLQRLREVLSTVDSELASAFADADPDYYSCFRWMLVRFKRELSFEATQRLWEVLWTRIVGEDELHIFVAAGLLIAHKGRLLSLQKGAFDALLRYINDMSMRIDVEFAVREGEMCYRKFVEIGGKFPTR